MSRRKFLKLTGTTLLATTIPKTITGCIQTETDPDPEYTNQQQPIQIQNKELKDLDKEPFDLFDGEITQNNLKLEYTLKNLTGKNKNPAESDQYNVEAETVVKLLEKDYTQGGETVVREQNTNNIQDQLSKTELENGVRENTQIPLPTDIRNYTLQTTTTDLKTGEKDTVETELNFADAYREARYIKSFETSPIFTETGASLRKIDVKDSVIDISYKSNYEIGDRNFDRELNEIASGYAHGLVDTITPYSLDVEVVDENGEIYQESVDRSRTIDWFEDEGTTERDILDLGFKIGQDLQVN